MRHVHRFHGKSSQSGSLFTQFQPMNAHSLSTPFPITDPPSSISGFSQKHFLSFSIIWVKIKWTILQAFPEHRKVFKVYPLTWDTDQINFSSYFCNKKKITYYNCSWGKKGDCPFHWLLHWLEKWKAVSVCIRDLDTDSEAIMSCKVVHVFTQFAEQATGLSLYQNFL